MKSDTTDNATWEVLDSEYIYRRPWLTARKDHVRLPNGNEIPEYYILEYPDWVNVIAITDAGDFVMVRQYRHGLGRTCYELCAGEVEDGEDPMDAAKRELMEETGFGGGEWVKIMTLSPNSSANTNLTHCYLATGVQKLSEQSLDAGEDLSVHTMSPREVKRLLADNEIMQALMVAPLWKYFTLVQ